LENSYLEHTRLGEFLETLRLFGELHGPTVSSAGVAGFSALDDIGRIELDYGRTLIPPKKYLLHFREEILRFREGSYLPGGSAERSIVLFGVHPCDLDGIAYLDRVFLTEPPDPAYASRRAKLILVGISCQPDDFCFCREPQHSATCDLFLDGWQDGYKLNALTAQGEALTEAARKLLAQAPPSPAAPTGDRGILPQDPQLRFSDNPLWDRFAKLCLACGACSVCCPTCYCFDVREYPGLTGLGVRLREWDNCLFKTHGEVAGANFRASRLERLRYRFLHKYCGFTPLEGVVSCVGCGRCKAACPVDIDLRELFDPGGQNSGTVS